MKRFLAYCCALAVATVVAYAPTWHNASISLDDGTYVIANPAVNVGLSGEGLRWAFANDGYASNWHPLTWLSHQLDSELFGPHAYGAHHAVGLLLHVLATLVLFAALRRMTGEEAPSAVVAALFALHPLHVESVAWLSERKDVLSGLLWMACLWAYARWTAAGGRARYVLLLVLCALGLMAKPVLVTLPLVLLLLDVWPLGRWLVPGAAARRGGRSAWWPVVEKLPLLALAVASSLVTMSVQQGAMTAWWPLSSRVINAARAYETYLVHTIWPSELIVFYPMEIGPEGRLPVALAVRPAVVLAVITLVALVAAWRGRAYVIVGWLWFLGTLVPMIGLVQVGAQALADRYTYIPLVGLFVAGVWGLRDLAAWVRIPRKVVVAGAIAMLLVCAVLTHRQVERWRNDHTLFLHVVTVDDDNVLGHVLLGRAYVLMGEDEGAKRHLGRALELDPSHLNARLQLAERLLAEGKATESLRLLREAEAVVTGPALAEILVAQAKIQLAIGRGPWARQALDKSLRAGPTSTTGVVALGLLAHLLRESGGGRAALYEERLQILAEESIDGVNLLAWALATSPGGIDPARAVELASTAAARTERRDANILDTLAAAYASAGEFDEAVATQEEAMALLPMPSDLGRQDMARRLELYRQGRPFRIYPG